MRREPIAGGGLLHPVALGAVLVLVVNDHYLKQAIPGWFTGKLSDVAGLIYFPLFLQGVWEALQRLAHRVWQPSSRVLCLAVVATAVVFSGTQLWDPCAALYRDGLGLLQSMLRAPFAGEFVVRPVALTQDPSDLFALPALGLSYAIGAPRCSAGIHYREHRASGSARPL